MKEQFKDQETKAPVYIVKNGLTLEGCDAIVKGLKDKTEEASHQEVDKEGRGYLTKKNAGVRNSTIYWFMDPELKITLDNWVKVANYQAGWQYDLVDSEMLQFTKYDGADKQHYSWHTDGQGCHYAKRNFTYKENPQSLVDIRQPNLVGTVRKISLSAILNDDYEGGEFQTMHLDQGKPAIRTIKPEKGSIILFPSSLYHRVKPVTKGIRYSVVAWYGGPPFK
jgi:PKHD-type hydroxylase